jgi:hypothetical protein
MYAVSRLYLRADALVAHVANVVHAVVAQLGLACVDTALVPWRRDIFALVAASEVEASALLAWEIGVAAIVARLLCVLGDALKQAKEHVR